MPCRDDRPTIYSPNELEIARQQVRAELEPLLCEACSELEEFDAMKDTSLELQQWFQKHEECEEDRVRLEAANKLTKRERRLLGIDLSVLQRAVEAKRK